MELEPTTTSVDVSWSPCCDEKKKKKLNQQTLACWWSTEWVWQQESHQEDHIHVYDEYPATTDEERAKAHMISALPRDVFGAFARCPLRALCPRRLARFVTARYRLSATACIDRTFFDEEGWETYDVYTFLHDDDDDDDGDRSLALPLLTPAPIKIVEYLRRFRSSLYHTMVQRHAQETKKRRQQVSYGRARLAKTSCHGRPEPSWRRYPTRTQPDGVVSPRSTGAGSEPSSTSGWARCARRQASRASGWSSPSPSGSRSKSASQSMMPTCGAKGTSTTMSHGSSCTWTDVRRLPGKTSLSW